MALGYNATEHVELLTEEQCGQKLEYRLKCIRQQRTQMKVFTFREGDVSVQIDLLSWLKYETCNEGSDRWRPLFLLPVGTGLRLLEDGSKRAKPFRKWQRGLIQK
jgi:hypothetical protein